MPFTILPDQPQYIGTTVTQGGSTEIAGLIATSLNADLLPATDVSAYKWFALQLGGTASGTQFSVQGSNDGVSFFSVPWQNANGSIVIGTSGFGSALIYGLVTFRYLRIRLTAYASGTVNGTIELYTTTGTFALTSLNVFLQSGEAHVGQVGGLTPPISATFVRPSNVTAYAANSVVTATANGALAIAGASRATGKTGSILSVTLIDAVNSLTPIQPIIWLFSALPTSLADGATLALSLADAQAKIGVIPLYQTYLDNSSASPSGIRTFFASVPPLAFLPASGTTIYAYVVSSAAYTPVSAESFTLILGISQD